MSHPPRPLPTLRPAELENAVPPLRWLIDALLPAGAAAILGGAPKMGKSFFALELATALATGTRCAGRFDIPAPARVLLLSAEDPPAVMLGRLRALARARNVPLEALEIDILSDGRLRLPEELDRLAVTIAEKKPGLLVLDPLIRLHRADENSAAEMSVILDGLRALARTTQASILLVHHARKAPAGAAGMTLRGSSDLAAFGDVNLFLRRLGEGPVLELRVEHRAVPSPPPIRLRLVSEGAPETIRFEPAETETADDTIKRRVLELLAAADKPLSSTGLRQHLSVRNQLLADALRALAAEGRIEREGREGWRLCSPER